MQFAIAFTILAATAFAAPAANPADPVSGNSTDTAPAPAASADHCGFKDVVECAAALGPAGITCVLAAVQDGLDPIADLPCLGSLINDVANPPASCKKCI